MDILLAPTMAQTHSSKKLHPLFSKEPPVDHLLSSSPAANGEATTTTTPKPSEVDHDSIDRRKRQKTDHGEPQVAQNDAIQNDGVKPPPVQRSLYDSLRTTVAPTPTIDPSPSTTENVPQYQEPHETPLPAQEDADYSATVDAEKTAASDRPRRVLKINMNTGTLGSPPKPKRPSRILCIKYGTDEERKKRMGEAITLIMNGEGTWPMPVTPPKSKKRGRPKKGDLVAQRALSAIESGSQGAPRSTGPPKAAHPFFGKGKNQTRETTPADSTHKPSPKVRQTVSMSTPISPRKQRSPFVNFDTKKVARFGSNIGLAGTKVPGAKHPMWPAKAMADVLGNDSAPITCPRTHTVPRKSRKHKGQVVSVPDEESCVTQSMTAPSLGQVVSSVVSGNDHGLLSSQSPLRLPKRHFESGKRLRARVAAQLRTYHADEATTAISSQGSQGSINHPALSRLYSSLETNLSSYDRSTCENATWAQKYAPITADEVLQAGKEGPLLRKWLEGLRIQAIDTGASDSARKAKGKGEKPIKKKRKSKLDGFIVDSEDELDDLAAVSEEGEDSEDSDIPFSRKTVIRGGKGSATDTRYQNAILISGPHGCGKTAAVYAVAKELDFEVFEINSSSRRSGKDIMDKIGDMTRNHLVHHGGNDKKKGVEGEAEDDAAKNAKSGKQGMMTSFFKPKMGSTAPKKAAETPVKVDEPAKGSTPRSQKQSLILLEEVDILYEEDKNFWSTVMTLITQSRRPFVMTCSADNESLVPTQTLPLHGILRLAPPPTDLAIDLCLLIAANEGHALQRTAVKKAYAARGEDLRATLQDLNYWCQIGVGDTRGGFDWFFLRWPKGSDLDENGDVVRVVSEDTYLEGMGWIGRDAILAAHHEPLALDQEASRQVWDFWSEPMDDRSEDLYDWAAAVSSPTVPSLERLSMVAAYDDYCNALSLADVLSQGSFGLELQSDIDPTLPDIPTKARDDYTLGQKLLEADPVVKYDTMASRDLSYGLISLSRRLLQRETRTVAPAHASGKALECMTEPATINAIEETHRPKPNPLRRYDIALAFDPLAVGLKALASHLDPSVFDRPMKPIVLDVAPWVRSIVAYDNRLMKERAKLSSLLSEGGEGKGKKRMRTTRAAYSALEGGQRQTTRRERYFRDIATGFVLRTAGDGWVEAGERELAELEAARPKEVEMAGGYDMMNQMVQLPHMQHAQQQQQYQFVQEMPYMQQMM